MRAPGGVRSLREEFEQLTNNNLGTTTTKHILCLALLHFLAGASEAVADDAVDEAGQRSQVPPGSAVR